MSTVRMCDFLDGDGKICGTIFSEREVGWSTGHLAVIDNDGIARTEVADFCPEHSPSATRNKKNYPRFRAVAALPQTTEHDPRDWTDGPEGSTT